MINAQELGKLLAEEVTNAPGPCLYPGKFHPPHKGHMKAALNLAARSYITEVIIILSSKVSPETGGITPEQALTIWKTYLQAQKNPKINIHISEYESPVKDMIAYVEKAPEDATVYVAVGQDETDDEDYAQSLQKMFGDKVKTITVQEKDGDISAPHIRTLIQQGDYEGFKEAIPVAAYNKGAAPKIWKLLLKTTSDQGQGTN